MIEKTSNLGIFHIHKSNRIVRPGSNSGGLEESLASNGWRKSQPMIVKNIDGLLYVIDGQHRLSIAKRLGIDVYYIVDNTIDVGDISSINTTQRSWSASDYLHFYCSQGLVDYVILRDFLSEYPIPLSVCIQLLSNSTVQDCGLTNASQSFKDGSYKACVNDKTRNIANAINRLVKTHQFIKTRTCITALSKVAEMVVAFDFNRFIEKVETHPGCFSKQADSRSYIRAIEDVYNRYSKEKLSIYVIAA